MQLLVEKRLATRCDDDDGQVNEESGNTICYIGNESERCHPRSSKSETMETARKDGKWSVLSQNENMLWKNTG